MYRGVSHGHLTGVAKVLVALTLSPLIGFWVGYGLHKTMMALLRGAHPSINRDLRYLHSPLLPGWLFRTAPTMRRRAWAS